MAPGVRRRTVNAGESVMQVIFEFEPNVSTPEHAHPHEQLVYVVAGEVVMTIAGRDRVMKAGETQTLKSNVPHCARTLGSRATLLDTFAPLREDFLAADRKAGGA